MQARGYTLDFSKPLIMGVLNVTPDSFSDGGQFVDVDNAVAHAKQMVSEGADIIDIGGESSRPGSDPVSEEEELGRVLPIVEQLVKEVDVPISIDTYKPEVARKCLEAGVHIVNDIEGGRNPEMLDVVAEFDVPLIIMHMLGKPKTMQTEVYYNGVIGDITTFFQEQISSAKNAGVTKLILDPGVGFGKTVEHNLLILKHLHKFTRLNCPLLVGTSRKSFIGKLTGAEVDERLPGTIVSNMVAVQHGVNIVRVHDVKECKQAFDILHAIEEVR